MKTMTGFARKMFVWRGDLDEMRGTERHGSLQGELWWRPGEERRQSEKMKAKTKQNQNPRGY
jgi:hypothetical protein